MKQHRSLLLTVLLILSILLAACGGSAPADTGAVPADTAADAPAADAAAPAEVAPAEPEATEAPPPATLAPGRAALNLWTHSAGNENEMNVIQQMVGEYNGAQDTYQVIIEAFPQASYNDSVAAASVAGSLPCILDLDQPTVPNFAWSSYVQELPVTPEMLADINTGGVGLYKDKVYSLGQFDVSLVNFARKSDLEKYNIRIPTMDTPWTLDEFNDVLQTLKDSGDFEYPIDVNSAWTGEWWSYAYSPMLQSFGGDLIDRSTFLTAESALNGPEAVAWGEWFQSLFAEGYANPAPPDDQAFLQGRSAIWYTGSWSANDIVAAFGDDALFLPAVDFGTGPKIGAASWQWGISSTCEDFDGAWGFIQHVMSPESVALMSDAAGLVPTTASGAALTEKYAVGGAYRVFFDMADKFALLRPPTPGYLRLSSEFEQAGLKIRDGANVQDTLDDAVDAINQDIKDNNGYGF